MAAWLRAACLLAATSVLRNGVSMPPTSGNPGSDKDKLVIVEVRGHRIHRESSITKGSRDRPRPVRVSCLSCTAQGSINARNGECCCSVERRRRLDSRVCPAARILPPHAFERLNPTDYAPHL
ncbi:hypothetical protein PR003_g19479 [Phytophthora rubi]|uniref:RxLR effector protein n=1 Tax=Phytophthora rubi TaxID=129364 RepID=A0A6A4DZ01_9STRA|nr:hypothetical protein PR001_g21271 [Phytophthora rubi]KAE8992429.1 hypothetical protein PR002_g20544 [Phytophthora rubi]KAE9313497.1 hypothetical protein PR003_g19479 [Phytophthora rubi]